MYVLQAVLQSFAWENHNFQALYFALNDTKRETLPIVIYALTNYKAEFNKIWQGTQLRPTF